MSTEFPWRNARLCSKRQELDYRHPSSKTTFMKHCLRSFKIFGYYPSRTQVKGQIILPSVARMYSQRPGELQNSTLNCCQLCPTYLPITYFPTVTLKNIKEKEHRIFSRVSFTHKNIDIFLSRQRK